MSDDELRIALRRIGEPLLSELARRGYQVRVEIHGATGASMFKFTSKPVDAAG